MKHRPPHELVVADLKKYHAVDVSKLNEILNPAPKPVSGYLWSVARLIRDDNGNILMPDGTHSYFNLYQQHFADSPRKCFAHWRTSRNYDFVNRNQINTDPSAFERFQKDALFFFVRTDKATGVSEVILFEDVPDIQDFLL